MSLVPVPEEKKPWQSKTLWVNAIVAVASFFPAVADKVSPSVVMQVLTFVNIILRFVTKDKVTLTE